MASDGGVPGAGCISLWSTTTESMDKGSMVKRGCAVRVLGDKRDGAGNVEDQRSRRPREDIVTSTGARWQDEKVGTVPYQRKGTNVRGADADPVVGCAVFDS